ncbi:LiaF transmembrane domain-containing protein [Herpetosiphon llansteffanensis]
MTTVTEQTPRRSLFWPCLLIGLGLLGALSAINLFEASLFNILEQFWPVLLIGAGLDLLLVRNRPKFGLGLALLVLAIMGVYGLTYNEPNYAMSYPQGAPLPDAAHIIVKQSNSTLAIKSEILDGQASIAGIVQASNINVRELQPDNDQITIVLGQDSPLGNNRSEQTILVSMDHAVDFDWNLRDVSLNADLTSLQIGTINAELQAGTATIALAERGEYHFNIDATTLDLTLPPGVPVRIHRDDTATAFNLDQSLDIQLIDDDLYSSPGWEESDESYRLDIYLSGSASSISIR